MKNRIHNILLEATAFSDRPNINDNFWKWFGDSKVVDGNGNPLVCYHGTFIGEEIYQFYDWSHFGSSRTANDRLEMFISDVGRESTDQDNIYPVYLKIKNPAIIPDDIGTWDEIDYVASVLEKYEYITKDEELVFLKNSSSDGLKKLKALLLTKGIDGIKYRNAWEGSGETSYITLSSNQIKSIFNQGTWNPNDPDIMR